jgi:hypothetical protein
MTMNMNTTGISILSIVAASSLAAGSITIDVVASSAPNFGSPSWNGYVTNALNSLENGLGNIGDRNTDPTAYEIAGATVDPSDFMVSSFNSWRGDASPTGAFASELGNRMHFGLHAYGDGTTQFRLEDVNFEISSNDVGNAMEFVGDFVGYGYSSTRFGVDWGANNAKGGGDDTYYFSGNGTTFVDEIVYVGVGNAFWPGGGDPDPQNPIGGAQAAMDAAIAAYASGFSMTGEYTISGFSGSDTVSTVPAPGALALLGFGSVVANRRRRA